MYSVDAYFAKTVDEGAHELRRHLENPDPLYSLSMTVPEKVAAAFAMQRLSSTVHVKDGFRRAAPVAAAVGLDTKVYLLMRSTLRKAEKEIATTGEPGKAHKSLSLMTEAVERSTLDYPVTSVVAKLHQLLLQGICRFSRVLLSVS